MATNVFNSLKAKIMYLNDGDRVVTTEGTGFVEFNGYGSFVRLDRGDTVGIETVTLRLDGPERPATSEQPATTVGRPTKVPYMRIIDNED